MTSGGTAGGADDSVPDWAAPERDVLATARERLDAGDPAVLATVVSVEGRAYRRPGATAVVTPDDGAGTVTAGCLTDRLQGLASEVLADGAARLVEFDLRGDDDVWGLGVGCDGLVEVLLEPLDERHRPLIGRRESRTAAVVVQSEDERLAVGDRSVTGMASDEWPPELADAVPANPDSARTVTVETDGGRVRIFVQSVEPFPTLLVVGSGPDVRPVVDLGRKADFTVTVAGFRGARATAERFPRADEVVATSPRALTEDVSVDADTYAVVMTHNLVDDRLAVEALLDSSVSYIGLMGPDERFERLLDGISDGGIADEGRERLYGPVGLDLGGGTPYQVAHSIVAEAIAVVNGRAGGHLRDGSGPIHDRE